MSAPSGTSLSLPGQRVLRAATVFLSLILHAALAHSVIFYAIFVLSKASWSPLPTIKGPDGKSASLLYGVQLTRVSKKLVSKGVILSAKDVQQILGNWLMVLAAAVLTLLIFQLKNLTAIRKQPALAKIKARVSQALRYQLPPYRFWVWWCGGLDIKDLFLVLLWVTYNFYWVYIKAEGRSHLKNEKQAAGKLTAKEGRLMMLKQIGASVGAVSLFQMAIVFFPVPRNTFLHHLFNTDFSGLLKYHRWLGYGLIYTILFHGLLFYVYWAQVEESFASNFFKWGNDKANNLAGSISTFFGLLILVTSMQWVRRLYFQVFIRCHIIGFLGFTAFAYIHFWQRWIYQTPGLILMLLDWSFRINQWLHPSFVTGVIGAPDKSIITLEMKWHKDAKVRAGQYVFLNAPGSGQRRFQWHPVTIADVDRSKDSGIIAKAHMKSFGAWTKTLVAEMLQKGHVLMRADGPYGIPQGPGWEAYNVLVIIAGGIGATPMLGMLRDIAAKRKALGESEKGLPGFPSKIILYWASRGEAEFALLDAHLVRITTEDNSWLRVHLYSTQTSEGARETFWNEEDGLMQPGKSGEFELGKIQQSVCEPVLVQAVIPAGSTREFQPYVSSYISWLCCHILAFGGAFFTLLLAVTYEVDTRLTGHAVASNWKTGFLVLAASFIGSMGLPGIYLAAVTAWTRNLISRQKPGYSVEECPGPASEEEVSLQPDCPAFRNDLSDSLTRLPVLSGRPNVRALLSQAVMENKGEDCVGVFAAGPSSMIQDVKVECATYNASCNIPHLDFHSHAFEL